MAKKDPFPNEWEEVNNLNDNDIETATAEEVMEDVMTWHLPQPYCAVIRVYDRKQNKLREYAYKLESKAHQRIKDAAFSDDEVTILTNALIGTINYLPE
jgi:vancomycin resistance protein YoaR